MVVVWCDDTVGCEKWAMLRLGVHENKNAFVFFFVFD